MLVVPVDLFAFEITRQDLLENFFELKIAQNEKYGKGAFTDSSTYTKEFKELASMLCDGVVLWATERNYSLIVGPNSNNKYVDYLLEDIDCGKLQCERLDTFSSLAVTFACITSMPPDDEIKKDEVQINKNNSDDENLMRLGVFYCDNIHGRILRNYSTLSLAIPTYRECEVVDDMIKCVISDVRNSGNVYLKASGCCIMGYQYNNSEAVFSLKNKEFYVFKDESKNALKLDDYDNQCVLVEESINKKEQ